MDKVTEYKYLRSMGIRWEYDTYMAPFYEYSCFIGHDCITTLSPTLGKLCKCLCPCYEALILAQHVNLLNLNSFFIFLFTFC